MINTDKILACNAVTVILYKQIHSSYIIETEKASCTLKILYIVMNAKT